MDFKFTFISQISQVYDIHDPFQRKVCGLRLLTLKKPFSPRFLSDHHLNNHLCETMSFKPFSSDFFPSCL